MRKNVACPHCRTVLRLPDGCRPGTKISCSHCAARLTVARTPRTRGPWLVLGPLLLLLVLGAGIGVYFSLSGEKGVATTNEAESDIRDRAVGQWQETPAIWQ